MLMFGRGEGRGRSCHGKSSTRVGVIEVVSLTPHLEKSVVWGCQEHPRVDLNEFLTMLQ